MSNAEILAELPKLKAEERAQVFQRLCELQEADLLRGVGPTDEEKKLLDQALDEFKSDSNLGAPGVRLYIASVPQRAVNWRVSIRAAADADLRQAWDWYEKQRQGLGEEFLLSIADAMIRLEEAPERFPEYYGEFRRLLTERFPYKIFFRIEGDAVIVFRILHAARDHPAELK